MTVLHMDCVDGMRAFADATFDSVVCDPPYELGFMGKTWDSTGIANNVAMWREALRVLKPGGHLLAFSGSRTYHRMTCAIEDAGFEIRDQIMWLYATGFPKAKTALKPAHEPICVARKTPIGSIRQNAATYGTGEINIDACRIPGAKPDTTRGASVKASSMVGTLGAQGRILDDGFGRYPTNVIHDGSETATDGLPDRFFYCAKASKADREHGLDDFEAIARVNGNKWTDQDYRVTNGERPASAESGPRKNIHPTVKPTDLMRYLCRLVTPPGGLILDPFAGSGSTGKAAKLEGFMFIGFEQDAQYAAIANARIEGVTL